MELSELTSFFSDAIYLAVLMVLVLISPGLLLGLLIAIFQAATQVNEQTLSFLPKLVLTLLMVLFAGQCWCRSCSICSTSCSSRSPM